VLLPSLSNVAKKSISKKTTLGYRRKRHAKGVYWGGHERKDVRERRGEYLAEMAELHERIRDRGDD
jgi:hypothetical protein